LNSKRFAFGELLSFASPKESIQSKKVQEALSNSRRLARTSEVSIKQRPNGDLVPVVGTQLSLKIPEKKHMRKSEVCQKRTLPEKCRLSNTQLYPTK
jgi:hypothetical protein